MKIKSCTVLIEWEDGSTDNVSDYIPAGTWAELEDFMNYWESEYGEDLEAESE